VKICVAIHDNKGQEEIAYALAAVLDRVGLPFEIADSMIDAQSSGCVWLHHGLAVAEDALGIVIPAEDPAQWQRAEPNLVWLDGVPVLYTGERPSALFLLQADQLRLGFDLARGAFWLLSRQEELGDGNRDAFGRFDCSASWLVRHGLAEVPVVDLYALFLAQLLEETARSAGLPLLRKLPWPRARRYATVLSHDVDDAGRSSPYQGIKMLSRAVQRGSLRGVARGTYHALSGLGNSFMRQADPYWNFETIMLLEAEAGFRSTFFFVAEASSVRRDPPYDVDTQQMRGLLGSLRSDGWEIAAHGSYDSYLDPKALSTQRRKLERVSGGAVRGIRQHYLRLQVPETFRAQVDAGFAYDGTVGYRGAVGFRAGAAFPFRPFDSASGRELPLLELPLTVMDGPLFWQLNLGTVEASDRTLALLETVRSVEGLAVLLWHQRVWNDKRYPGWHQVYGKAVAHLCEEGQAWVATAGQVADWWLAREALQLESFSAGAASFRWLYRAGRAVEGVVFELWPAGSGKPSVLGAEASILTGEDRLRLEVNSLVTGQSLEIRWTSEEEAS
jgi:hypothetical protein